MSVIDIECPKLADALGMAWPTDFVSRKKEQAEDGVSPALDDYRILHLLARFSHAKNIFEFGTCVGGSARSLALNSPEATIFSLDLDKKRNDIVDEHELGLVLAGIQFRGILCNGLPNVVLLRGDSREFDFSTIPPCDLVFIDGGHDYKTVKSDTENAIKILNKENPNAVIVWHDCSNSMTPDVTRLTNELAVTRDLIGCLGLMMRFFVPGRQFAASLGKFCELAAT